MPLYDGEDLESLIRFRILNDKVIVEEVPKSKEQQQKEDEQRKVKYYNPDSTEGRVKTTYTIRSFARGEIDPELEALFEKQESSTNE